MVDFSNFFRGVTTFARDAAPFAAAAQGFRAPANAGLSTFDKGLAAIQAAAKLAPNQVQPRGSETGQSVAVSITDSPPRETAVSGEAGVMNAAFRAPPSRMSYGGGISQASLPAIIGGGRAVVQGGGNILGMLGLAGGAISVAPLIIDPLTGEEKKLRVTRKLRSNVKKAVEMFGVDFVADQMGTSVDVIFYILTKRMRNDGPAITKAALRKTRSTMRKLDAMCDMRDKMRPPARRATRARTTSKVMQIKN